MVITWTIVNSCLDDAYKSYATALLTGQVVTELVIGAVFSHFTG